MYILIVNSDPLGRSLAATLVSHGHEVAYLDDNAEYCNMVASELGCLVIHGETTNIRVLREAGIERADVLVALLDKDIKNILLGLFGRQFNVPVTLARLRQEHYRSAYELAGITNIFSAFEHLRNQFLIAIEDPNVRQVMVLGDGHVEIAAIDIPAASRLIGQPLSALWEHSDYPDEALLLGLLKADTQSFRLPRTRPTLEAEDALLALATPENVHRITDIITGRRRSLLGRLGT